MRFFLCLLIVVVGCNKTPVKQDKPITLADVPEVVMKAANAAAKKNFPDIKFETVTIKRSGVYEITGRTKNGKVHDVEVKPDGDITEIE
ncbi:MAG TPA: hypothetical protein VGG64_11475 [Pirellulales bacterium]|jgi:hypothetical protein